MRFRISGTSVNLPVELKTLPIQLYESQNYLAQPEVTADYAQRYLEETPVPTYYPTRATWTRWTLANDVFGANVVSLLEALRQGREMKENMQQYALQGVPTMDYYEAANALGANRLPEPRREPNEYARIPLAKNALPIGSFVTADELMYAVRNKIPL